MLSVQRWLTKSNRCLELIEASAAQARLSVEMLAAFVKQPPAASAQKELSQCRAQHKRIVKEITEHLCTTFVTPLEREDLEKLSNALNRVSKAVDQYIEHCLLAPQHVKGWDLSAQAVMLEQSAGIITEIVGELCQGGSSERINELNARMQQIETNADRMMEHSFEKFYGADEASVRWIVQKDLSERLEKVFDRCRSVGNTTQWTMMRNS